LKISLHVLILSQVFPPDLGGHATRAYNVAKGLMTNGVEVTVVAAFPHYPYGIIPRKYRKKIFVVEHLSGIKVVRTFVPPLASKGFINRLILFSSFIISSVISLPLIGRVDAVFASNPQTLSIFPAVLFGITWRSPIALNVDDLWPESLYDLGMLTSSFFKKISEFIALIAYSVADVIIPISPAYIDTLLTKYRIRKDKIKVVLGGVDLAFFNKYFSSQSKNFIVLYVGAFSPAYNFDQVLYAAKILENENVKFILRGGGEMASSIRKKILKLNLNNVDLIEKVVSREKVAEYMMRADALILPLSGLENVEKGISSKLYEYQAAKKPIICCSSGQPGRYILKTKSGIVIKPGDYEKLAQSIIFLKENPLNAQELGESGRQYVEKNVSIELIGLEMKNIFIKISKN